MSESVFYGQIGAFFVGFVSAVTCTVTCCWNLWSISSDGDSASVLGAIWGFNGIWIECMQHTSGAYQCDSYGTAVFNLPTYMNCIRAMMCIAIIFSILGCFTSLVGMQASRLLETVPNKKRITIQVTGSLFIIAGVLTTASLGWYAGMVMTNFFSPDNLDNLIRYTIGATFYVGVVSATFSFIAGSLFLCLPGPKEEKDDNYSIARFMNAPTYASTFRRTGTTTKRPYFRTDYTPPRRNTIQYV